MKNVKNRSKFHEKIAVFCHHLAMNGKLWVRNKFSTRIYCQRWSGKSFVKIGCSEVSKRSYPPYFDYLSERYQPLCSLTQHLLFLQRMCFPYTTPCVSTYAPVAPPLQHMVYHFLFFTHPIIALSQKTQILMSIFFLQHPVLSVVFCAQCVPPKFIQIKVFQLSDCKEVRTPKNAPALQKTWTKTKNNM